MNTLLSSVPEYSVNPAWSIDRLPQDLGFDRHRRRAAGGHDRRNLLRGIRSGHVRFMNGKVHRCGERLNILADGLQ